MTRHTIGLITLALLVSPLATEFLPKLSRKLLEFLPEAAPPSPGPLSWSIRLSGPHRT
jgi:hypothetical protein